MVLTTQAMALGLGTAEKLETVVKRLHSMNAPKARPTVVFPTIAVALILRADVSAWGFTALVSLAYCLAAPKLARLQSALVILLALSDNVVVFSEVSGQHLCAPLDNLPTKLNKRSNYNNEVVYTARFFLRTLDSSWGPINILSSNKILGTWLIKCVWLEAYTFVELFCGEGWVSRIMRTSGCCTASLDIRLATAREGKQNPFDLTTDAGFLFFDYNK